MITFKKLGHYGNLGNQLHQIASMIGLADRYKCEIVLPKWKYAPYFTFSITQQDIEVEKLIQKPPFECNYKFWDYYREDFVNKKVDILAYLQSEKFWEHCRYKVLQEFTFQPWLVDELKIKYRQALIRPTIAISVRRGDFVTNPNYYLLPDCYYLKALEKYFTNKTDYNILIFSDDESFCKEHFSQLPNVFFGTGEDNIHQLCLMSMCQHFIISNSTFSWWGAMLGEKEKTIVVRSPYVVRGKLEYLNLRDYFPNRWICFDHENNKTLNSKFNYVRNKILNWF